MQPLKDYPIGLGPFDPASFKFDPQEAAGLLREEFRAGLKQSTVLSFSKSTAAVVWVKSDPATLDQPIPQNTGTRAGDQRGLKAQMDKQAKYFPGFGSPKIGPRWYGGSEGS